MPAKVLKSGRLRQNVIIEGRPGLTLARAGAWVVHCALKIPATVRIGVGGPRMRLRPRLRAYGSTCLYMKRMDYEPELAFMAALVRPGDSIVDIGANFGVYSLVFAQRAGETGCVHAFEPGRDSLELLRGNCELNPSLNVEVMPVALSEHPGQSSLFHIGGGPATFSLGGGVGDVAEQVQVTTLDTWASEAGLTKLDLLKIDVEGHEPKVFAGGTQTLAAYKPLVMFEVSSSALARNGSPPDQSFKQLVELGYHVYNLNDGGLKRLSAVVNGNLFAVHPESGWSARLVGAAAMRLPTDPVRSAHGLIGPESSDSGA